MGELVLDCVVPYLQQDNLNSSVVSLVSKRYYDIDSLTRKHLTVHVHFLPDPSRLSHRFPNIESLTLKSYSHGYDTTRKSCIPVAPWIHEIAKFEHLKSLSIRNMVVTAFDLRLLAKTQGASLRSIEICRCKMFSEDGLEDIARCCIDLRSLRLYWNDIENDYVGAYRTNGNWFHELALCNSVMKSLEFDYPFDWYDIEDVTLLAKKCSESLVFINIFPQCLREFREVFKHAKKLEHFGYGCGDEDHDYSGFRFPPNIRGLRIEDLTEASFPFLLPYLNQLRELELKCVNTESNCQCYFFKRCPNLEVLKTVDICNDKGLKAIGQFCKKLRKLTHYRRVTRKGLIWLAKGCPNLEYLDVYSKDISNKTLECVGTCLKNLRVFRIHLSEKGGKTCFSVDNGVRAMLIGCKKLERLDIHLFPGALTDIGLGYVGAYGHNLRHVSLRDTGESDVGLVELLKGCPKLRKLKLNGCPFSKQAIATVFSINQTLRYVWLDYGSRDVSVVTRPMVYVQVLTKLYLKLAETLHRLAIQLVADGSDAGSVKITYASSRVTDDTDTPLIRNMVASSIRNEEQDTSGGTSEKPLEIIVRIANVESRFTSAVSEFGDIKLQGRVKDGVPHLTKVGVFEVDVRLGGHILLCRQVDEPNTIGSVASILGNENVNISTMGVYRATPRKQAVMVIAVDEKPSNMALKKIDKIPAIREFVFLAL